MNSRLNISIFGCLFLCASIAWCANCAALHYDVSTDDDLRELHVSLVFGQFETAEALNVSPAALSRMKRATINFRDGSKQELVLRGSYIALPRGSVQNIDYQIDTRDAEQLARRKTSTKRSSAIRLGLDEFLIRPHGLQRWQDTQIRYSLPSGMRVSSPGKRVVDDATIVYALLSRPVEWRGYILIGQFAEHELRMSGARHHAAVVDSNTIATTEKLQAWLRTGLNALAGLYGRFPVTETQILIFAQGRSSDPVPWGEVMRGGGDSVHLYVDATASLETLNENWVLVHELAHLLHPYVARGASWLPEGIASYYQNVLRARAGLISPRVAWEKLHAGFDRGRRQTTSMHTLERDTRTMMRDAKYMRVYWSGAAIALIGDVELRRRSSGRASLATVLDRLSQCCLPTTMRWPSEALMKKLDELAGFEIFESLYNDYVMNPGFPDVAPSYAALGLSARGKQLRRNDNSASARLRKEIMGSD